MIAKSARPIPSQGAFRAALAHAVFAALLVLLSDRALGLLFRDPEALVQASMVKGWAFVAVTTLLLYVLVDQLNASYRRERTEATERQRVTQLLAAIAKSSSDAMFSKDEQGRYLLLNDMAARYMGRPAEELLGHDDRAVSRPSRRRRSWTSSAASLPPGR